MLPQNKDSPHPHTALLNLKTESYTRNYFESCLIESTKSQHNWSSCLKNDILKSNMLRKNLDEVSKTYCDPRTFVLLSKVTEDNVHSQITFKDVFWSFF